MATLDGTSKCNLDLTYNAGTTGYANVQRITANPQGSAVVPDFGFVYGTGTVVDANNFTPVNDEYKFYGTITAGATKSIDLIGGSDTNPFGTALAFVTLKYFLVAIIAPDGIKTLRVGPQNVANAWAAAWGGAGSTVYETVYWRKEWFGLAAGATVTADTADLFQVKNPGAGDLTVLIVIAGKK